MQIGTTVVALIGEVIGFSYTRGSFRTAHSITALCVVFVTFPQVSLGAAAMRKSSNPNYNKLHRGTGYFLVGLALWQVRKRVHAPRRWTHICRIIANPSSEFDYGRFPSTSFHIASRTNRSWCLIFFYAFHCAFS